LHLVSGSTQISLGQQFGCARRNHELWVYLNFVGALLTKWEVHQQICIVFQSPSRVKSRPISIFLTRKDWTLNTMNLTVPGLCTHPNLFMTRNKLNHVSGRDSLWYMTSNLCDLLMDKDPITQYKTNFFECLCFSWKWKRYCSHEREV
jgi:hypothetical protein